jgi:hypothetical protein
MRETMTYETVQRNPIQSEKFFTSDVMELYQRNNAEELMLVLGNGSHVQPEQQRGADAVMFSDAALVEADRELVEIGAISSPEEAAMTHSHLMDNGHGIGERGEVFSDQDLQTMAAQHQQYGKDRFGLIINGNEMESNWVVGFQHAIMADHEGELLEQEWASGERGRVMTLYTDEFGEEQRIFSETIEDAQEVSEKIVHIKELAAGTNHQGAGSKSASVQIAYLKELLMAA